MVTALLQLQRQAPARETVLHAPYMALDHQWLSGPGRVRLAYGVAAGVTYLLNAGAIRPKDVEAAKTLVQRALDRGMTRLADASATQQGILEYHYAQFLLLERRREKAQNFIETAIVNHGGKGAAHMTQLDIRLQLQALLPRDPPPSRRDLTEVLDTRGISMRNPQHPVLTRAAAGTASHGRLQFVVIPGVDNLFNGLESLLAKVEAASPKQGSSGHHE